MKNRVYKYFFHEFIRYFAIILFALTVIIWTLQAVNFLDLVTQDGHAFKIYLFYSILTMPKVITKLIPFTFLLASLLTIYKFEKDNELIILWTAGLNKIHIVNLIFRISILILFLQLIMASIINPKTLNFSRTLLKNSELQFVPSLLKEKKFNDTVKGLTVFVDKKNLDGTYENIFIRDEGRILTKISDESSTIFARSGYVTNDEQNLVLLDGYIHKLETGFGIDVIKFKKTVVNLSGITTKSISETKIQETPTLFILECVRKKNFGEHNCSRNKKNLNDTKSEINRRLGMPLIIPLLGLISCFVLKSQRQEKFSGLNKYVYFLIGLAVIISSEITVRYSGISLNITFLYYLIPVSLLPLVYFFLIRSFKYENLN